ncbi:MAG: 30S ribosome-binding factor RbfA [Alphaproteobacteria bacterium]|nr:30S ribosome-binding factor RbfA [Alphaproteobacteria bacterium]
MRRPSKSSPGQRQLRVAERIRHLLAGILRESSLHDPDLGNPEMITVTGENSGPDLKHAHVFVLPLGGGDAGKIVAALNRAEGYFRKTLAKELELRYAPKLTFRPDNSFDEAAHIEDLLGQERVRRDIEKKEEE